jgi:tetratricopeptide (TPR) repeat protein
VLFAFDPTFLAHSPLVKNDVPITLVTFALFWTVWLVGRHATFIAIGTLILMSAFTLTVKFSGVVLVPIAAVLLFVRALMSFEWPFAGRKLANRWSRLALAMLLAVLMAASAYVSAWASYGFRFQASAAGEPIDTKRLLLVSSSFQAELERPNADEGELRKRIQENVTDDWSTRLTEFALRHRLMPEAWLNGLLIQREWMRGRPAYLCGHYSTTGWWYYFPLAVLFKSPLGTILAAGVLIICVLSRPLPYITRARDSLKMPGVWTAIAFSVPVAVYGLMALTSHINIGVRHVLPLYPFGFLAIALGLSYLIERRPRVGRTLVGILFAVLTAETLIAWPHYLAFFNIACGGYRGGFHLLADSNLDWGQDLPLLSKWQRARPNERLYFDYDKNVPPIVYDIRSASVGQYSIFAQPAGLPDGRPYVAVGATVLQKVYSQSELYDKLLKVEPTAVLGGSIYVWAENSAALNWLGVTLMNMNRIPESLSAFKRAIELQPDNPLLHKNLASALNRSNRNAEAIEQLRLAIKLDPNDAIAHNNLGTALHSAGDHQAAIAEFERAVELRPDVVSSRLNLAEMLRQQGEHSRAIKQYQIVLTKEATSARAYAGLARSLAMLNRSREAIETAQKGITSARSNGQQAEAEKIEEWLGHYQREIERGGGEEPKPQAGPAEK